jgi:hypothetical protein
MLMILNNVMAKSKKRVLLPKFQKILEQIGGNIKLAWKCSGRSFTGCRVRKAYHTRLYHIKKWSPSVSPGPVLSVGLNHSSEEYSA